MARTRRTYWQFGLRSLVLGVAVVAVVLGWARSQVSSIERALREEQVATNELNDRLAPVIKEWFQDSLGSGNTYPEVTFRDRESTSWDWLLKEDLRETRHVESISLTSSSDAVPWLRLAERFPFLRGLTLRKFQNVDAALWHLRASQRLEELRLLKTDVTDAGLAHLDRLTMLRDVVITDVAITDAGLAALRRSPHLDRLVLPGSRLTDPRMATVLHDSDWNLKELNLGRTAIGDETIACLSRHSRLERIRLHQTLVEGSTLAAIESLPGLTHLAIDGPILDLQLRYVAVLEAIVVPEAGELCLDDLPSLRWLMSGKVTDDFVCATRVDLRNLPKLEDAFLRITKPSVVENLASLGRLSVESVGSSVPKIRCSRLPQLTSLVLTHVDWRETNEHDWSSLSSLRDLEISADSETPTDLGPQDLRRLTAAPALRSLKIGGYAVSDDAAQFLERLSGLKQLKFRHARISPEAIGRLRRALPQCDIDPNDRGLEIRIGGGIVLVDEEK